MNVTELTQVQVDPEDHTVGLMFRLAQEYGEPDLSRRQTLKLYFGRYILHRLGTHTWVRWLHYDRSSERVIDTGGRVCAFCTKGRLT
jgi:hypothetical protein